MTPLYIVGAGGHGRVVADIAAACGENDIRFIDSQFPSRDKNLVWPIVASDPLDIPAGCRVFLALGNNSRRKAVAEKLAGKGFDFVTLTHPTASVSRHAHMGKGSVVMPMAVVNAGSQLGNHVIINTAASVDHDCCLADFVHVSPGVHLAGTVTVGEGTWVCIGASVREGCVIGAGAVVAAGAVVVRDIQANARVYGVPAKQKDK